MSKVSNSSKPLPKPKGTLEKSYKDDNPLMLRVLSAFSILCIVSSIVFDKTKAMGGSTFPIMGLLAVGFVACVLAYEKKLTVQNAAILLMAAGFVLRLNYVIYTPLSETSRIRQHDLYEFGGTKGHSAYIEHFYNNGFKMPDFNPTEKVQFYHPPLHHFLAALWMRLLTTFGMGYSRAIGSIMFLTLFYSSIIMIVCERIFSRLRLAGAGKLIAVAIVAFHPTLIILSGSINNDELALLFTMLAIYTTLRWYEDPTMKNILLIAISIGLGMSTKLSAALVSLPIALIFLLKLIEEKKRIAENILQYCVFGVVCLPLGLWFSVRNAIKFDVPFTYVARLSDNSDQYVGDKSVYERLFDISYHPFENVFLNRVATGADFFEYNPLVSICKTSLFGEYNFADTNSDITPFCRILLVLNIILILLSIAALVYFIIQKGKLADKKEKIFLAFYQILLFCYFIKFCFDFPHNCSMDFRYIVPTFILGSYFIGASVEQLSSKSANRKKTAVILDKFSIPTAALTCLFCLSSAIVYIMLGVKK